MNVLPTQAPATHALQDPPRPAPPTTQEISRPVVAPNQPAAMNEQQARPDEHPALREDDGRTDQQRTATAAHKDPGSSLGGEAGEGDQDRPQARSGSLGSLIDVFV